MATRRFLTRSLSTLSPRLRPLIAVSPNTPRRSPAATAARGLASPPPTPSLCAGPYLPYRWSDVPGVDFEHWRVVLWGWLPSKATRDEIIDGYIKTLAKVVGSEEEARRRIYSVYTKMFYSFGVLASEELANKIYELPEVSVVLPDDYLDDETKQYGGEPFINGQAVPFDLKYYAQFLHHFNGTPCKIRKKLKVSSGNTGIGAVSLNDTKAVECEPKSTG